MASSSCSPGMLTTPSVPFLVSLTSSVPQSSLVPHTSILMLFTTSALSHIFPEIRVDAVRFLDIFLSLIPQVVVSGWTDIGSDEDSPAETSTAGGSQHGKRVLNGYMALFDMKGKPGGPLRVQLDVCSWLINVCSYRKSPCWISFEPSPFCQCKPSPAS